LTDLLFVNLTQFQGDVLFWFATVASLNYSATASHVVGRGCSTPLYPN